VNGNAWTSLNDRYVKWTVNQVTARSIVIDSVLLSTSCPLLSPFEHVTVLYSSKTYTYMQQPATRTMLEHTDCLDSLVQFYSAVSFCAVPVEVRLHDALSRCTVVPTPRPGPPTCSWAPLYSIIRPPQFSFGCKIVGYAANGHCTKHPVKKK